MQPATFIYSLGKVKVNIGPHVVWIFVVSDACFIIEVWIVALEGSAALPNLVLLIEVKRFISSLDTVRTNPNPLVLILL